MSSQAGLRASENNNSNSMIRTQVVSNRHCEVPVDPLVENGNVDESVRGARWDDGDVVLGLAVDDKDEDDGETLIVVGAIVAPLVDDTDSKEPTMAFAELDLSVALSDDIGSCITLALSAILPSLVDEFVFASAPGTEDPRENCVVVSVTEPGNAACELLMTTNISETATPDTTAVATCAEEVAPLLPSLSVGIGDADVLGHSMVTACDCCDFVTG